MDALGKDLGTTIAERYSRLESDRTYWMSQWQTIAEYVMPRKSYILSSSVTVDGNRESRLFDTTAVRANMILSAGCMSYITPADSRWCGFEAPKEMQNDEGVTEYFAKVTEIVMEALARSNFHSSIHELYLDRGCFGTAVLTVEPGNKAPLVFKNVDVGSFCLAEDSEGNVDTYYRKFELTARQMVQEFGHKSVSKQVQDAFDSVKDMDKKFEVIHGIYPRTDRNKGKFLDPSEKPFASCHVECQSKHVLRESGYDEAPFMATRYLKWQWGVYGYSPSWVALPDIRQLQFLQKQMDALAELAAFPRVLIPDSMEGTVDLRPGGITYFNASDPGARPIEWATVGRYDMGLDRVKQKQRDINDSFHVPLFQLFTNQENQASADRMTATEVNARNAERLAQFSPTFSRLTTELLIPLLTRVYGILARRGALPPPPEELLQQSPDGEYYVPTPNVIFNSRIALAVRAMELMASEKTVRRATEYVAVTQDPAILDNFDMDQMIRDGALAEGMDADFLVPMEQVRQMRQQRMMAQQQQEQMAQGSALADMAQKAGSIPSDSPLLGNMA